MSEREHESGEEQAGEQPPSDEEEREAWEETNDEPAQGEQGQDGV
jgi:hypothetical protein